MQRCCFASSTSLHASNFYADQKALNRAQTTHTDVSCYHISELPTVAFQHCNVRSLRASLTTVLCSFTMWNKVEINYWTHSQITSSIQRTISCHKHRTDFTNFMKIRPHLCMILPAIVESVRRYVTLETSFVHICLLSIILPFNIR